MNYKKIHDNIISRAISEKRTKNESIYYENHHIIPKCIGGSNKKSNLVLLTGREHFLIHWLLSKVYPHERKLIYAFNSFCMNTYPTNKRTTSKLYEFARQKFIELLKSDDRWKRKMASTIKMLIWIKNESTGESLRITESSFDDYKKLGFIKGRARFSRISPTKETRIKMSKTKTGKPQKPEHIEKVRKTLRNRIWMNKNEKTRHINKKDLDIFISDGWNRGR